MKKRIAPGTARPSSTDGAAASGVRPPSNGVKPGGMARDSDRIVVPKQQFDALLTLLDDPPSVSDDLRRDVARRRWT